MDVAQLSDLHEIEVVKARYFRLLDSARWDEFRQLFTDDLECYIDDPRVVGNVGDGPAFHGPDAFVTQLIESDPARWSAHHGHMPELEFVDEDTVRGVWAMFGWGEYPTRGVGQQVYGHYEDTYRRCPDGSWRICRLRLTLLRHAYVEPRPPSS